MDGSSVPVPQCPPVVVVLEDLEGFPANVLQDFVTICRLIELDIICDHYFLLTLS